MTQLPALQILLPLVAAPLCVLLRRGGLAWALALLATAASLAVAAALMAAVADGGVISYSLGGWAPPWGIEYRIDAANALFLVLVAGIGVLTLLYARDSIDNELPDNLHALFYTVFMLCLAGLLGVIITGDAFNVFVFLEISSLSTYVLVAMGDRRDPRALTAAYKYLIAGTVGATFFVIGIGLLYALTGTLNMADIARRLPDTDAPATLNAAFGFIVVGLGLKIALFPLHAWLPDAYARAPSAVTAFLAATATKAAIYVLLRFMTSVFNTVLPFDGDITWIILAPLAAAAMIAASVAAIFQDDVKRLFAWSSIAQIGFILLGAAMTTAAGLTAALLHLINHALIKGALFMALGCVVFRMGGAVMEGLRGTGPLMPWTMTALTIAGLSLVGVPLTAGFVSKWLLVQAALEREWWIAAWLIVIASLLTAVYVWRVLTTVWLHDAPDGRKNTLRDAPAGMLVPLWILAGANIWFGIDARLPAALAERAAFAFTGAFIGVAP